jgi:hypothetical protein
MTATARHSLVRFDDGGLLLDLESGALFQLNESAAEIWEGRLAGKSTDALAAALTAAHSLSASIARSHVVAALTGLNVECQPNGEYRYERSGNHYVFSREGVPLIRVNDAGDVIEWAGAQAIDIGEIRNVLLAISPKLLALRGNLVLHASAVLLNDAVVALCGESGAGKTTTARALVRAGATPVCEDKLIVRSGRSGPEALMGTEQTIDTWSRTAATSLMSGTHAGSPVLDETAATCIVRELGFIDVSRRTGNTFQGTPLSPIAAAAAIFRNSFYGSDVGADWQRQLTAAVAVARGLDAYALATPDGLASLETAAVDLVGRGSIRSL